MYEDYQHLCFTYRGRVLTITMNRPEVKNAANVRMHRELSMVFHDVARDPDCDVVVLTGAGDAFSSGGDIAAMREKIEDETKWVDTVQEARALFYGMLDLDKPLIARINGAATGIGATLLGLCGYFDRRRERSDRRSTRQGRAGRGRWRSADVAASGRLSESQGVAVPWRHDQRQGGGTDRPRDLLRSRRRA